MHGEGLEEVQGARVVVAGDTKAWTKQLFTSERVRISNVVIQNLDRVIDTKKVLLKCILSRRLIPC